jgi:hypothetical protein
VREVAIKQGEQVKYKPGKKGALELWVETRRSNEIFVGK